MVTSMKDLNNVRGRQKLVFLPQDGRSTQARPISRPPKDRVVNHQIPGSQLAAGFYTTVTHYDSDVLTCWFTFSQTGSQFCYKLEARERERKTWGSDVIQAAALSDKTGNGPIIKYDRICSGEYLKVGCDDGSADRDSVHP